MPGIATNIVNITSQKIVSKPQVTLVIIMVIILFMLFSERAIGMNRIYSTIILLIVFSVIIVSTFFTWFVSFGFKDDTYVVQLSNIFNLPAGRNFISVFLLVFFIIYIYENEEYDNNTLYPVFNKLSLDHNKYFTNRMAGIFYLLFFVMVTAYTMHLTTNKN